MNISGNDVHAWIERLRTENEHSAYEIARLRGDLAEAVRNERQRCSKIAERYAVMFSQIGSREKERTAASIKQEIDDGASS